MQKVTSTEQVRRAAEENRQRNARTVSAPKTAPGFVPALAAFVLVLGCGVFVFLHEEARISELQEELQSVREPLAALRVENAALTRDKVELESRLTDAQLANRQQIDELKGRSNALKYEKETLFSDVSAKEKKIAELEAEIAGWYDREAQLMKLIETAKTSVSMAQADAQTARAEAAEARTAAAEARVAASRAQAAAVPAPAASTAS